MSCGQTSVRPLLIAALAGVVFAAGLALGGMMDPRKVQGFLDFGAIGSGRWDPSLAFVMGGALMVSLLYLRPRWHPRNVGRATLSCCQPGVTLILAWWAARRCLALVGVIRLLPRACGGIAVDRWARYCLFYRRHGGGDVASAVVASPDSDQRRYTTMTPQHLKVEARDIVIVQSMRNTIMVASVLASRRAARRYGFRRRDARHAT